MTIATTYRYEQIELDKIAATDLREEALTHKILGLDHPEAYTVTIRDASGEVAAETADALYLPDAARMGVAWGADADWGDAWSVDDGIWSWLMHADEESA